MNTEGFKPQNETQEDSLEKIRADIESGALTLENASMVETGINTTTADSLIKEIKELGESNIYLEEMDKEVMEDRISDLILTYESLQLKEDLNILSDSQTKEVDIIVTQLKNIQTIFSNQQKELKAKIDLRKAA